MLFLEGDTQAFARRVNSSLLPKDITDDANEVMYENNEYTCWNGCILYELLNDRGISGVEFSAIHFEEFSTRRGDTTHTVTLA